MWVIKVSPQTQGPSIKTMVNVFVLSDMHFEEQAMEIKRLYYKYNARRVVLDANGLTYLAHVKLFELLETPNVKSRAISS